MLLCVRAMIPPISAFSRASSVNVFHTAEAQVGKSSRRYRVTLAIAAYGGLLIVFEGSALSFLLSIPSPSINPLPHVACHVHDVIRAGARRILRYRGCFISPRLSCITPTLVEFLSPRVSPMAVADRCFFPFLFGRQSLVGVLSVCFGFIVTNPVNRMIGFANWISTPLPASRGAPFLVRQELLVFSIGSRVRKALLSCLVLLG